MGSGVDFASRPSTSSGQAEALLAGKREEEKGRNLVSRKGAKLAKGNLFWGFIRSDKNLGLGFMESDKSLDHRVRRVSRGRGEGVERGHGDY